MRSHDVLTKHLFVHHSNEVLEVIAKLCLCHKDLSHIFIYLERAWFVMNLHALSLYFCSGFNCPQNFQNSCFGPKTYHPCVPAEQMFLSADPIGMLKHDGSSCANVKNINDIGRKQVFLNHLWQRATRWRKLHNSLDCKPITWSQNTKNHLKLCLFQIHKGPCSHMLSQLLSATFWQTQPSTQQICAYVSILCNIWVLRLVFPDFSSFMVQKSQF